MIKPWPGEYMFTKIIVDAPCLIKKIIYFRLSGSSHEKMSLERESLNAFLAINKNCTSTISTE